MFGSAEEGSSGGGVAAGGAASLSDRSAFVMASVMKCEMRPGGPVQQAQASATALCHCTLGCAGESFRQQTAFGASCCQLQAL